jgi:hypothetical protein
MGIRQTFDGSPGAIALPRRPHANVTKKNHFVPCFYSSLWTGEDGKLCEFTRPYDRVKALRKHPAATGYSNDLYTEATLSPGLHTYLEDIFLKRVDQKARDALQFILADRIDDLSTDLRCAWARFIMSMVQRSPARIAELRNRWKAGYFAPDESIVRRYLELRNATEPATLKEYLEQGPADTLGRGQVRLIQAVMDLPKVGEKIVNMKWGVLTISDVIMFNFLTSDRPIIMTNGIGKDGGHIGLPIGPRKLFLAADKQETIDAILDQSLSDLIMATNTTVARHAEKFVYGESDMAINFVEKHLRR